MLKKSCKSHHLAALVVSMIIKKAAREAGVEDKFSASEASRGGIRGGASSSSSASAGAGASATSTAATLEVEVLQQPSRL